MPERAGKQVNVQLSVWRMINFSMNAVIIP
jgi:hypothetical protein